MKINKNNLFFLLIVFVVSVSCKQNAQQAKEATIHCDETYTELTDPTDAEGAHWDAVEEGLQVSYVSIDKRYPKSVNPDIPILEEEQLVGWRGEKVSAQILLWTTDTIPNITVKLTDFKGKKETLPADIGEARFVRYVMTDEFAEGCGYRKPEDFAASLSADVLDTIGCMTLEAQKVRPVWITVSIPHKAVPGTYQSNIEISEEGQTVKELALNLKVIDQELPAPSDWSFHLDQWQHPSAVARVENVELWSEAHFEALKPVMQMLADAGQKVITTTLNKDPWNVQTYDPYDDMILWTKKEDGAWTYDYTVFDKWVEFMMGLGIKDQINAYSIVPWNNELHYIDEASGDTIDIKADPGTPEFTAMWEPFLRDFATHLKEKGWLEITNIAMDERDPKSMDLAFALIDKVAPDLGVAFADNQKTYQRYPNSKDVSVAAIHPFDKADLNYRREHGLISTFYVYCGNEFPNQFTFSDPAEATYLGWYALAGNFDGFLRWSYNSWVKEPLLDSRFRTWPAGDTYVVYPGGRSSIRFERTVEGIQDFEKVKILKNQLEKQGRKEDLTHLNNAIEKMNSSKRNEGWNDNLNAAKQLLNKLSEK